MKSGDLALTPQIAFNGTKATITAWAGAVVGMEAYATDTSEKGIFDGSAWRWSSIAGGIATAGVRIVSSTTNLTSADVGKQIVCEATTTFTVRLPNTTTVPVGGIFSISNQYSTKPISIGTDGDQIRYDGGNVSTIGLSGGESMIFIKSLTTAKWEVISATYAKSTAVVTSGSSTAYTITTPKYGGLAFSTELLLVSFHTTAGATPTLNRDGLGAKSLKYYNAAGAKTACGATTIISGMISQVVYDGTDYVVLDIPIRIAHSEMTEIGTNTHAQIDTFIAAFPLVTNSDTTARTYTAGTWYDIGSAITISSYGGQFFDVLVAVQYDGDAWHGYAGAGVYGAIVWKNGGTQNEITIPLDVHNANDITCAFRLKIGNGTRIPQIKFSANVVVASGGFVKIHLRKTITG